MRSSFGLGAQARARRCPYRRPGRVHASGRPHRWGSLIMSQFMNIRLGRAARAPARQVPGAPVYKLGGSSRRRARKRASD